MCFIGRKMQELAYQQRGHSVRVHYSEAPSPMGWAGKKTVEVTLEKEMLPIYQIKATLIGRDQGNFPSSPFFIFQIESSSSCFYI